MSLFSINNNNKKIKLFFTNKQLVSNVVRLLCIAILIIIATFSFSWFSMNKKVSSSGISMSLHYEDVHATYSVYMWNIDEQKGSDKDWDGDDIVVEDILFHLHDPIFLERNKYTPVVIRIAMSGSDLLEEGTVVITVARNTAIDIYSTLYPNELSEYASSILRLTCGKGAGYYDKDTNGNPNPEIIYDRVVNGDNGLGIVGIKNNESLFDSKLFTTATKNGDSYTYTKEDSISFQVAYTSSDWNDTDGNNESDTLNIYILMDYDTIGDDDEAGSTLGYDSLTYIYSLGHNINSEQMSSFGKSTLENDLVYIRAYKYHSPQ